MVLRGRGSITRKTLRKSIAPNLSPDACITRTPERDKAARLQVREQLRSVLASHAARVLDLFREWDDDGDGLVSYTEFR